MHYSNLFKLALLFFAGCYLIAACNTNTGSPKETGVKADSNQSVASADSTEASCAQAEKYPNNDKPMALMMRQMADNAQKMKELIEQNKAVTAEQFPFIRFHLVEPTDPDVLQPQFFENARQLQLAHKALISAPAGKQRELYTAYINQCINCHQIYCSGPLKRIRKLVLSSN